MDAIGAELFEQIENGSHILKTVEILIGKAMVKEKKDYSLFKDKKAKNLLLISLNEEKFENVVHCTTTEEV